MLMAAVIFFFIFDYWGITIFGDHKKVFYDVVAKGKTFYIRKEADNNTFLGFISNKWKYFMDGFYAMYFNLFYHDSIFNKNLPTLKLETNEKLKQYFENDENGLIKFYCRSSYLTDTDIQKIIKLYKQMRQMGSSGTITWTEYFSKNLNNIRKYFVLFPGDEENLQNVTSLEQLIKQAVNLNIDEKFSFFTYLKNLILPGGAGTMVFFELAKYLLGEEKAKSLKPVIEKTALITKATVSHRHSLNKLNDIKDEMEIARKFKNVQAKKEASNKITEVALDLLGTVGPKAAIGASVLKATNLLTDKSVDPYNNPDAEAQRKARRHMAEGNTKQALEVLNAARSGILKQEDEQAKKYFPKKEDIVQIKRNVKKYIQTRHKKVRCQTVNCFTDEYAGPKKGVVNKIVNEKNAKEECCRRIETAEDRFNLLFRQQHDNDLQAFYDRAQSDDTVRKCAEDVRTTGNIAPECFNIPGFKTYYKQELKKQNPKKTDAEINQVIDLQETNNIISTPTRGISITTQPSIPSVNFSTSGNLLDVSNGSLVQQLGALPMSGGWQKKAYFVPLRRVRPFADKFIDMINTSDKTNERKILETLKKKAWVDLQLAHKHHSSDRFHKHAKAVTTCMRRIGVLTRNNEALTKPFTRFFRAYKRDTGGVAELLTQQP